MLVYLWSVVIYKFSSISFFRNLWIFILCELETNTIILQWVPSLAVTLVMYVFEAAICSSIDFSQFFLGSLTYLWTVDWFPKVNQVPLICRRLNDSYDLDPIICWRLDASPPPLTLKHRCGFRSSWGKYLRLGVTWSVVVIADFTSISNLWSNGHHHQSLPAPLWCTTIDATLTAPLSVLWEHHIQIYTCIAGVRVVELL